MKYKTIGAFKNVQNVPYCKAAVELHTGMGVVLDRVAKTAALPANDDAAKGVVYIVSNINDKPELRDTRKAYVVEKDEFVRADDLRTVNGLEIELAAYELSVLTSTLNAGDKLVFGSDGLLKKVADVTGYAVHFKVIAKTAYMDDGILAEIVSL